MRVPRVVVAGALLFARAPQPGVNHRHLDALPLQAGRLLDRFGTPTAEDAEPAHLEYHELELD